MKFLQTLLISICLVNPAFGNEALTDLRADLEQQYPQWGQTMQRAKDLLGQGSGKDGMHQLKQALELARRADAPLLLAESLEAMATHEGKVKRLAMLEEAYELKERELGPRHPAIVETMLRIADALPEDPDKVQAMTAKLNAASRARDILVEAYGDETCEVGRADNFAGYVYRRYGDPVKAEETYRYLLWYCPVKAEDHLWESAGVKALSNLRDLLLTQDRDDELASLPVLPERIEVPVPKNIPPFEVPSDVPPPDSGAQLSSDG